LIKHLIAKGGLPGEGEKLKLRKRIRNEGLGSASRVFLPGQPFGATC